MTKSEKSCRHEKLMGSQTPSDRIVPDYAYTDGPDAVKVLAVGKLIVDPWQSEVLNDWMGVQRMMFGQRRHVAYLFQDRTGKHWILPGGLHPE